MQKQNLKIIFTSFPEGPIDLAKNKRGRKSKYFYLIIGARSSNHKQYTILKQIFRIKNRVPNDNFEFEMIENEAVNFNSKFEVMNFIYNFLETFSDHRRIVNSVSNLNKKISLDYFIKSFIPNFISSIIEYMAKRTKKS